MWNSLATVLDLVLDEWVKRAGHPGIALNADCQRGRVTMTTTHIRGVSAYSKSQLHNVVVGVMVVTYPEVSSRTARTMASVP